MQTSIESQQSDDITMNKPFVGQSLGSLHTDLLCAACRICKQSSTTGNFHTSLQRKHYQYVRYRKILKNKKKQKRHQNSSKEITHDVI